MISTSDECYEIKRKAMQEIEKKTIITGLKAEEKT
jgi:hypothetical protein